MEWMIASVVAGLVGGVVAADAVRVMDMPGSALPWAMGLAVCAVAAVTVGRRHPWPWLILAGGFAGFAWGLAAPTPPPVQDSGTVTIEGTFHSGARPTSRGWAATMVVDTATDTARRVQVRGSGAPPPRLARARVTGHLRPWSRASADYMFDGAQYAAARGWSGSMSASEVQFVPPAGGSLGSWRLSREAEVVETLGPDRAALVLAIVTGSRGLAARERRAPINDAGLGHLLAISGLHLVTVGGLLIWVLGLASRFVPWARQRWWAAVRWALPLTVVLSYASMCGWPVSAQRAATMFVVWRLGVLLRRPAAAVPAISAAVLVSIAGQGPDAVFDPGLQLSVAAVVGIVAGLHGVRDRRLAVRLLRVPVLVTLASTVATAPFTMTSFGRLPVLGALLNLVAVPMVQLVALPAGLAGFVLPAPIGTPFLWMSAWTLAAVEWLAGNCPAPGVLLGIANPAALAAGLALSGILALLSRPRAALAALLLACLFAAGAREPGVFFLPVGQGDAIVAVDRTGAAILVDAGGDVDRDVGTGVVAPALARLGARLEVVVVSHPDADHVAGLASVIRAARPSQVWVSDVHRDAPELAAVRAAAGETGAHIVRPPRRARLGALNLVRLDRQIRGTDNDQSVVYELELRGLRVLLTGDVERAGEAAIARRARPVHLLKVAHHGSRTSSTEPLLRAARAPVGVISAGADNRFGHPHTAALGRLDQAGVSVWSTADCGHIEARAQDGRWTLRSYLPCAPNTRPAGGGPHASGAGARASRGCRSGSSQCQRVRGGPAPP